MRTIRVLFLACTALVLAVIGRPAAAQFDISGITVDVHGGASTVGRMLEQYSGTGEREVRAANGFAFGGSLGVQPWESTAIRLGATWAPSQIEFRDDSGVGAPSPLADVDDVADLDALVLSLEAAASVLGEFNVFRPYTILGVSAGWWMLDDTSGTILTGGEDTKFGFGATGGLGLEIRPAGAFTIRLEAAQYRLRNPFDGEEAWDISSGITFDEPDAVSLSRYSLGVGIAVGG